jgi:hypothetical protein
VTLSALRSSDLLVPPRFATQRDDDYRTMGPAVAKVATALGTPLMPWQRYVADVGGEVDADGRYRWPLVICTVPRQAGKTTLLLAQAVHRCLQGDHRFSWHTAQTGKDAREKWRELADAVMGSPLRPLVRSMRKGVPESLTFTNGSKLSPHAPMRDALHGRQSDHSDIDEAWAFDEAQGTALLQAIQPTQATRPGAQTWLWSTRGDRSSTWFHGLIARAYAGEPGIAIFDWSIPDDLDPGDLDAVAAHHPAYGLTIGRAALEGAQAALPPGEFARAYGNRATGAGERVIPLEPWLAARTEEPVPAGRPAYGIAVSADGSAGAIAAAVLDPTTGIPWVEVIEHRPGRSWLVDRVRSLRDAGQGVTGDRLGPAAPVIDQLELAGVDVIGLGGGDYPAACQDFYDRVADPAGPRLRHRMHGALDDAADIAGKRLRGDGAWVWSRTRSAGDISALEAATLAAWTVLRNPAPAPAPLIHFG